jgi:hypothetical protein
MKTFGKDFRVAHCQSQEIAKAVADKKASQKREK